MEKQNKTYVTIPYLLVRNLPKEKKYFRVISVYYQLKGLYNCGCIKNYRKRYQELSKKLGIGESTLRLYISELKKAELVEISGKNLLIKSKYKLVEYCGFDVSCFGTKIKSKDKILKLKSKTIRFEKVDLYKKNKLIEFLYALKIYDNIEHKQKTAYIEKVVRARMAVSNEYRTANKKGKKRLYFQERARVYEDGGKLSRIERESVRKLIKTDNFNPKFYSTDMYDLANVELRKPDFTLSRKGVARILGRRSSTWGSSIIKKLKERDYLSKDDQNVVWFHVPANTPNRKIQDMIYGIADKIRPYYKGCVIYYCKYNSTIVVKTPNTIKMCDNLFFKHYIYINNKYSNINPTIVREIF